MSIINKKKRRRPKTIIEIEGLTEAQEIAIEDMLKTWESLGGMGSSRWTSFYADGDGNFRPKIKINGKKPQYTTLLNRKNLWENDEYRIDFDTIAWALRGED